MKHFAFCFLAVFQVIAFGKSFTVCPACKIKHPVVAVNAANAGDTIFIQKGNYSANLISISKPLSLIGLNYPVLDGGGLEEIVQISSSDVLLRGLTIRNSKKGSMKDYAGIRISGGKRVRIEQCRLEETFFGIYIQNGSNCIITNNILDGGNHPQHELGNGIHLWKTDSSIIAGNLIQGHRDGIYLEFAGHCLIEKNTCTLNYRYGLHFMFSDHDRYVKNIFKNNGTGVAVMYSKHVEMEHNRFEDNWGEAAYGLLLKDISRSRIEGNTFQNNTVGITMEGSSKIYISRNIFTGNGYALKVMADCIEDTVTVNNFRGNTFDAATNGELKLNFFKGNYWDKYEGYDLNRDGVGDIPFHPVSLYCLIIEQMPYSIMLLRSFATEILNRVEKSIPGMIPETFIDVAPTMKPNP